MTDAPPLAGASDPGRRGGLALAVAAAVDTVSGVRRSAGGPTPLATLYRGGQVNGVALDSVSVTVQVTVTDVPAAGVAEIGDQVRRAADAVMRDNDDHRQARVVIDDIDIDHLPPQRPARTC
ncbi:MAG: hypothetical protein M3137_05355 [Actinomycetota bacterium]|nr:hypothetical protein [Actinomycetota bacterium]